MPSPPFAQVSTSVNGGATAPGAVDVPSAATLQFTGVSTVGWTAQRYEIYEYPEGFATPAGWTLDPTGIIYSTAVVPPLVTLPANAVLWGPWSVRLRINEAVSNNATTVPNLTDVATICNMLSPKGQRMIAALEGTQNCTATTLQKAWVRTIQRNQIIVEPLLGGAGGNGSVTVASRDSNASTSWVAGTDYLINFTATGLTGTLPGAPTNGQQFMAKAAFAAGSLTVNGGGHNIELNPAAAAASESLNPGESRTYTYSSTSALWMRD